MVAVFTFLRQAYVPVLAALAVLGLGSGGCARIVPPMGGAKDTLAPVLVRSIPEQGSVNYRGRVVSLVFDEDIAVQAINQQLVISPIQDNPYQYKVRGRSVTLEFEKAFPDSTTVFLNFRGAVQDITESNKPKGLRLAFATGPVIDTFALSGTITDLATGKPVENATVALYPASDTADIRRQRPRYYGLTEKDGTYALQNLGAGTYLAAAFGDYNSNVRWSGKREPLGYLEEPLVLSGDTGLSFKLSVMDDQPPRLDRPQTLARGLVEVRANEGLTNLLAYLTPRPDTAAERALALARPLYRGLPLSAKTVLGADSLPRQPGDQSGAFYQVLTGLDLRDTTWLRLIATDSAGLVRDTVLRLSPFRPARGARPDTARLVPFRVTSDPGAGSSVYLPGDVDILLPEPLPTRQNSPAVAYVRDTILQAATLLGSYNRYRNRYRVRLPQTGAPQQALRLAEGAFRTQRGQVSRGDTLIFGTLAEEQTGLIRGTITAPAGPVVVELLSDQGVVLRQVPFSATAKRSFELLGLAPGNYQLRLILDANGNGRYDAGSYQARRQPEAIIPPGPPLQVKANWEVETVVGN